MRTPSLASIAAALVLTMGGVLSAPALAQADGSADAAAAPAPKKKKVKKASTTDGGAATSATAKTSSKTPTKKRKPKKGEKAVVVEKAPVTDDLAPPPTAPSMPQTTVIIKAPAAPPVAPEPDAVPGPNGYDDEPPTIAHTAIKSAMRNKPLVFAAHIVDPSGVFQPVLYLRKRGTGDYLPFKMIASKTSRGEYAVEVDAKLISVDLEYYVEAYDNAGNGPARIGSPENPLEIALQEPKQIVVPGPGPAQHPGSPPAITHQTVSKAFRMMPIEINAKLVGETGVSKATVFFRHSGEHDFRVLPMGNIGGDDYTATIPASIVTEDLEYYLEAYDQYGNGPARSGGPNVPYQVAVTDKPVEIAQPPLVTAPPVAAKALPHLVKLPFTANPGRAAGYLFMAGFVATAAFAGGELYGAYNADQAYQQSYNYDGKLDQGVHQSSLNYEKRARNFGIISAASLAVGVALLLIFPEHPETQLVTGDGDVALAHF